MKRENTNIEVKNKSQFKAYLKLTTTTIQKGLQAFSNNIFVKSLVSGFVSTMPVILVSSIFILLYALPEAISPDYLASDNAPESFKMFKAFCVRTYQFTYGIIGLLVTGNICRAMGEELNLKLPYNNRMKTFNLLICGMIIYFVMSAITIWGGDNPPTDMSSNSWFDSVGWTQMGAQGMLPGMIIGLTTPWIFYWCYKYNITIRMPKAVPGVISQSFLSIIPFGISLLIWSVISYLFILFLGQPFVPWFFEKLGGFIPTGISHEQWDKATTEIQKNQLIQTQLNSFSNSYGIIFLFRFLETTSWFIGVHPEAIQGVFESVMAVNQEMNEKLASLNRPESFSFVNSLMGPSGSIGGTGATFVFPIICLMFAKSEQLKVAGKTSVVPTSFQVNEPILFGAPIILNPYFIVPFMAVPMINSSMAKVFVDHFGMRAARIDLPWAIPSIIRMPLAQNGQWQSFILLIVVIAISFFIYLPFIMMYDRALLKEEIEKVGKENFIAINGIQYQLNKNFYYDFVATKKYKKSYKDAKIEFANDLEKLKQRKDELNEIKKEETATNLITLFERIKIEKIKKANSNFQDEIIFVDKKISDLKEKQEKFNERIENKIENYKMLAESSGLSFDEKIDLVKSKIMNEPKAYVVKKDYKGFYDIKIKKINYDFEIKKLKIKNKVLHEDNLSEINILKEKRRNEINEILSKSKITNLEQANSILATHKNPYKDIPLADSSIKKDEKDKDVKETKSNANNIDHNKTYNVLVLCIGAGTSAMLANAITDGAKNQSDIKMVAKALAYDSYKEALNDTDLIITSPQLRSYLSSIEEDANAHSIKVVPTKGKQYIDLTNNPDDAFKFACDSLFGSDDTKSNDIDKNIEIKETKENDKTLSENKTYNVLVLCIGAGTSAMLANAITEGAKKQNKIKLVAKALAYDSYKEALNDTDLIITSPQLRSYLSSIEEDAKQHSIKVVPTKGKQYIDLTNNSDDAFKFAVENLEAKK